MNMSTYALITGASQGLGKYIALELAKRNYNLLLVARSALALEAVKTEIVSIHAVNVTILALDLSVIDASSKLRDFCISENLTISVLVNNAGFGLWGNFEDLTLSDQQNMINLNISTLTSLTHYLLPFLTKNKQSYILQIASTAAYQSVPSLAVYAASKAYVLSFTRSLHHELKPKGVYVTCLCPGPMATGFSDRAGMQALSHLTEKYNMNPEIVAKEAIKAMLAGKIEVVPGSLNKMQRLGDWLFPKYMVEKIAAKLYSKK
jgi:uncharacterized protein